MSWDKKALLTASQDGSLMAYKLNYTGLLNAVNHQEVQEQEITLAGELHLEDPGEDAADIIDDSIYSIQQAKLLAEQDARMSMAEDIKKTMR